KVAAALNDIVTKARQVDELVARVSSASQEQIRGITQINAAVAQMGQVTHGNSTRAEESAAGAQQLNGQAAILNHSVSELLQLVGGSAQQVAVKPSARIPHHGGARANAGHTGPAAVRSNGHHPAANKPKLADRRNEIPLDGDFKGV